MNLECIFRLVCIIICTFCIPIIRNGKKNQNWNPDKET